MGKMVASVSCYSEGTLLVEFREMCADVKEVTITKSMGSAKQQYQSVSHHHFFRTAHRSK